MKEINLFILCSNFLICAQFKTIGDVLIKLVKYIMQLETEL